MTLHSPRAQAVPSQGASSRAAGLNGGPGGGRDSGHEVGVLGGLAALSLDALTRVAYGPQAMIVILVLAGGSALRWTVPFTVVIAAILVILVFSYTQGDLRASRGRWGVRGRKGESRSACVASGSRVLVVDYVLTVAVSLAVGAASLASVFPALAHHLLLVSLVALVVLTTVSMFGITVLIRAHGVVPRGNVTILAQLPAGTFGKGAVFYVCNLSVGSRSVWWRIRPSAACRCRWSAWRTTTSCRMCSICGPSGRSTDTGSLRWRWLRLCCWSSSTPRPSA